MSELFLGYGEMSLLGNQHCLLQVYNTYKFLSVWYSILEKSDAELESLVRFDDLLIAKDKAIFLVVLAVVFNKRQFVAWDYMATTQVWGR